MFYFKIFKAISIFKIVLKLLRLIFYGLIIYFILFLFKTESQKIQKNELNINDILITIKTSSIYHATRLRWIQSTWYQFARYQVFLIFKFSNEKFNNFL